MGRQSSRILINGQDAKQVIACDEAGTAYDIDQIWMSDKESVLSLAWEKLKALGVTWEVAVGEITPSAYVVRNNGSVLCLVDSLTDNVYISSDGKTWNEISNPFGYYGASGESLVQLGNGFAVEQYYKRYSDDTSRYRPVISSGGTSWEIIEKMTLVLSDGSYREYTTELSAEYPLNSNNYNYANGKYVSNIGSSLGVGQTFNYLTQINIKTSDENYEANEVKEMMYINGYYYFIARTNSIGLGVWRTTDFSSFEMLFFAQSAFAATEDRTCILMEHNNEIIIVFSESPSLVSYKSSDGINFEEYNFLYDDTTSTWNDFVSSNQDLLIHAYSDRIFVNDTEYLLSDMYDESLSLYYPHVNIMGNKIYVTYTDRYGENPIVTFIGTVEG